MQPPENAALPDLIRILTGRIDFGSPTAGAAQSGNFWASWVVVSIDTLDAATTITHNLDLDLRAANVPNVGWLVFQWGHSGAGASAASGAPGCMFETGDTVGRDSIQLRFYAPGRTVAAGANELKAWILFFPMAE